MKRFNKAQWIGFLALAGLTLYLFYLLSGGKIISFIHPERISLMWGTLFGLAAMTMYQSTKIFTIPSRKQNINSFLPLLFILFCGVSSAAAKETDRLPDGKAQSIAGVVSSREKAVAGRETEQAKFQTAANESGVNQNSTSSDSLQAALSEAVQTSSLDNSESDADSGRTQLGSDSMQQDKDDRQKSDSEIILNNENYTKIIMDIEQHPDQYSGKKVTVEGFVYRDKRFTAKQFVAARLFMVCCAADAQLIGFMCEGEQSSSLKDKQWIKVKGVLEVQNLDMNGQISSIPVIKMSSVSKLPTPENQYVYY